MRIAIYPGSFDPVTLGHLNIIERAAATVDKLIVGVLENQNKSPLFTAAERVEMIGLVTKDIPNVEARAFNGLTIDFARQCKAQLIVRGLRAITDFEYELQMAQTNHAMCPEIDTIFLTTNLRYAYLSSSIVKEVAYFDGNIEMFVPEAILPLVKEKLMEETQK